MWRRLHNTNMDSATCNSSKGALAVVLQGLMGCVRESFSQVFRGPAVLRCEM